MKTFHPKLADIDKTRKWWIIDASGLTLGKLATKLADVIRGKNKPSFHPSVDCGDYVIVINAEKVRLTGSKMTDRVHFSHTGYPGGQRTTTPEQMFKKNPTRLVETAVRGMLPKNRLGRQLFHNLHVYTGTEHLHTGQKPKTIDLSSIK